MATSGFAPPSLSWSSTNLPEAYRSFRQYTTLIFDGPFANKTEKEKVTYLLIWIGSHGRDIYEGWTWNSPDDKFKLKLVLDKFQQHIEPQVNSYLARYNFHKSRQTADESVDEFVARLRVLAAKCKFADVGETHVRLIEQIIVGTKHVAVQEKLLEKGRLPLQLGRSFGHRSDLRGDEVSCRPAAIDVEFYSARRAEAAKLRVSKYQLHALRTGPFHDCDMPSERRHMPELWQAQPLGSSVQSQTWSKGPSTRQISTRSTTREQQAEGKTATAQSPVKGR